MKIPFTASARTAMLIGSENFSNPEGAIIELVKNTYDADSPCCYILFDGSEDQYSDIYIIDYGCGMSIETITDCWMQIGTDDKQSELSLHILSDLQVKARIVDQDHDIGLIATNVVLAETHVAQDGAQVAQHGDNPHKRHLAIMLDQRAAHGRHQVASQETEVGLRILRQQRLH